MMPSPLVCKLMEEESGKRSGRKLIEAIERWVEWRREKIAAAGGRKRTGIAEACLPSYPINTPFPFHFSFTNFTEQECCLIELREKKKTVQQEVSAEEEEA